MKLHAIKEKLVSTMHSVASFAAIAAVAIAVLPGIARADGTKTLYSDDFDISTMTTGWNGYARKNKSIGDTTLTLVTSIENEQPVTTEYEKGFGAQATSDYTISLGGEGVSFSVTVGRDFASHESWDGGENTKKLKFQIFDENNNVLAESSEMTRYSIAENFNVDLTGKQSIRLHIDPVDGDSWDWGDWVNPTLVMNDAAAGAITVNENAVVSDSIHTSFTSATVTKGVFAFAAGASFSGGVSIAANGAIAVNMAGKVSAENLNGTIDLFSTPTLTLASGDSVEKAVFLYGPVVGYTIGSRVENGVTVVYATITDVSNISSTRKVTVFTAGYADAEHWNDVSGNWGAGAPSKGSFDIGVFCEDASINYMTGYVFSHGDFVVRGATVTAKGSNSPNLDMLRFAGNGTVIVQNASVDLRSGCSLAVDAGVTVNIVNGTVAVGTGDVSFAGTLVIGEGAKLKVYGYEDEEVGAGSVLALVPHASFAEGVTSATVAVVGHDAAVAEIEAGEGDAIVARVTKIAGETTYWIGGEEGNWWEGANWDQGTVPTIIQTAVFTNSATVFRNGESESESVSNLVISADCRVELRSSDIWVVHPSLYVYEVSGEGRLALAHSGIQPIASANGAVASVAEIEIVNTGNDSWLQGQSSSNLLTVHSAIVGNGKLNIYGYVSFAGDNSAFTGTWNIGNEWGQTGRARFASATSGFTAASGTTCYGDSRIYIDTADEVLFTALSLPETSANRIVATVPGARLAVSNDTANITLAGGVSIEDGASLAIRKLGEATLVDGLVGAYALNVEKGHVQLSAGTADVSATVAAGASIGSATDVTIGALTLANGAKVLQTVAKTADEVEEGTDPTYTYTVPVLTATGSYNVGNVLFGITNPEDMPIVTDSLIAEHVTYPIFAATGSVSGKPAAAGKYKTAGGASGGRWMVRLVNEKVCLRAGVGDGCAVKVR